MNHGNTDRVSNTGIGKDVGDLLSLEIIQSHHIDLSR